MITLEQNDQAIRGTWRHTTPNTAPGYRQWSGNINGSVVLAENGQTHFGGTAARRLLWRVERRKEFCVQISTAAIYTHPHGRELRVFLDDESDGIVCSRRRGG